MHKRYSVGQSNDWLAAVAANLEAEAALIGRDPLLICDIKGKKQTLQARHTLYNTTVVELVCALSKKKEV